MRRAAAATAAATLAALAPAAACNGASAGRPRPPGPVASALVAVAAELGVPPAEAAHSLAALDDIAARVAERHRRDGGRTALVDSMNAVVFDELGFEREITRTDLDVVLLPRVLAGRRGSCLGLGGLYLAVGERLGLPLDGVVAPGHFFVRLPSRGAGGDLRHRNIELLRRGEALPDAWYAGKYGPWSTEASAYLRPLSLSELSGVFWFNAGNRRREAGDLQGAERAYARAAAEFPALGEAHASLALARQLRGDLVGAAAGYRAAARARPDLPGLGQNVSVLDAEVRSR
jgi:regulator of sirC expression with transglutaminase-like and TPR domain